MIEFANKEDVEQIKKLWKNVFGDSDDYIIRYLKEFLPYVCIYKENRFIKGMVSLIPITMNDKKGRYVYAAATEEKSRGRGIATKLLEYAQKFIKQQNEDFLVLVPAEKSLFDFYKKRGYRAVSPLKIIECDDISSGSTHLEAKKILPKKLSELREKFFKKENFIAWGEKELEYIWKIYDGNFFHITGDEVSLRDIETGEDVAYAIAQEVIGKR